MMIYTKRQSLGRTNCQMKWIKEKKSNTETCYARHICNNQWAFYHMEMFRKQKGKEWKNRSKLIWKSKYVSTCP